MVELHFEGASDDTFGEVNHFRDDYDNCASEKPIAYLLTVPGEDGGLVVVGQFAPTGLECSWLIGVAAWDPGHEDLPIPDWKIRFEPNSYMGRLVVEAPDGVQLRCLTREVSRG